MPCFWYRKKDHLYTRSPLFSVILIWINRQRVTLAVDTATAIEGNLAAITPFGGGDKVTEAPSGLL
jgi:hypothetical protein